MEHILGIDLHSDNGYYGIIEPDGKRVFQKRIPNDLPTVLTTLEPYRETIISIVVESTYNWYWLVDGLMENGYNNRVRLANPAGFSPYKGLKHADDKTDAFFLTELERLGILPVGHIYPKEERPVRDLLRRRMMLVHQKTSHLLSFQSLITRQTGTNIPCNNIKKFEEDYVKEILDEEHLILAGETNISIIRFLTKKIRLLERAVLKRIKLKPEYEKLLTVPGIGKFAGAGNYTSYCRCVKSKRMSNSKKKGEGNRKNGNKYLEWAYVEAANFAKRFSPEAKKYYQRKMAKTNQIVATKALASKISKACYFIMRDQEVFKTEKIFG
ncbi:MAG: transposase [Deltaproteobacteria bacterium]|nr:transposase [Deltaproteobacteria bacterium]